MMPQTTWFFLAYGAGLFYLLINPDKVKRVYAFRSAWRSYALAILFGSLVLLPVPFANLGFTVFAWVLIAISAFNLYTAVAPERHELESGEKR